MTKTSKLATLAAAGFIAAAAAITTLSGGGRPAPAWVASGEPHVQVVGVYDLAARQGGGPRTQLHIKAADRGTDLDRLAYTVTGHQDRAVAVDRWGDRSILTVADHGRPVQLSVEVAEDSVPASAGEGACFPAVRAGAKDSGAQPDEHRWYHAGELPVAVGLCREG